MQPKLRAYGAGFCLLFALYSIFKFQWDSYPGGFFAFQNNYASTCSEWDFMDNRPSSTNQCLHVNQVKSVVWTFDGSGLMKYIQWIATRQIGDIRITRLDHNCGIIDQKFYSSNWTRAKFVLVYVMSLSANFANGSKCAVQIKRIVKMNVKNVNQIFFKRKSIKAMVTFQQLDLMKGNINFNQSLDENIRQVSYVVEYFQRYFIATSTMHWIIVNSEDLIKTDVFDCEKTLIQFFTSLGLDVLSPTLSSIVQYESHLFINDSTWWDRSDVAENVLYNSIPVRPSTLTYSDDFYYLSGNRSFPQYLADSRRCYTESIFPQLPSATIPNRTSSDQPDRCPSKRFDCAFSDLYSFEDREQLYQKSNWSTIKCGLAIPSVFDRIRERFGRNHTCETIIYMVITNCYDPLPTVRHNNAPSFCFLALLDTVTFNGFKKLYTPQDAYPWEFMDLGPDATPFSAPVKTTETLKILGPRLFPLAKWIVWIDGKAHYTDLVRLLKETTAPIMGSQHEDPTRTSASEVDLTLIRVGRREQDNPTVYNTSLRDIKLQQHVYHQEGFYSRADQLKLGMIDIAILLYRNHHPCVDRYLCGWHNEVNYFSYRGQLSVYYSAVRLNLTDYLHYVPKQFYMIFLHRKVC